MRVGVNYSQDSLACAFALYDLLVHSLASTSLPASDVTRALDACLFPRIVARARVRGKGAERADGEWRMCVCVFIDPT